MGKSILVYISFPGIFNEPVKQQGLLYLVSMCTARLRSKVLETALSGISLELGPRAELLCRIQPVFISSYLSFPILSWAYHNCALRPSKQRQASTRLQVCFQPVVNSTPYMSIYTGQCLSALEAGVNFTTSAKFS